MRLEEQVISVKLALTLKAMGVKQESVFQWGCNIRGEWSLNSPTRDKDTYCAAFTASELLAMFVPIVNEYTEKADAYQYGVRFGIENPLAAPTMSGIYYCVSDIHDYPDDTYRHGDNFANVLAEQLIFLIEKGYVEGYNERRV